MIPSFWRNAESAFQTGKPRIGREVSDREFKRGSWEIGERLNPSWPDPDLPGVARWLRRPSKGAAVHDRQVCTALYADANDPFITPSFICRRHLF